MQALHQQFSELLLSPFQSGSQRAAFDDFVRDSGAIPTMVVCAIGFILMTLVYVGMGLFDFLRLPLIAMLVVSTLSSAVVLSNRWRDRLLFDALSCAHNKNILQYNAS